RTPAGGREQRRRTERQRRRTADHQVRGGAVPAGLRQVHRGAGRLGPVAGALVGAGALRLRRGRRVGRGVRVVVPVAVVLDGGLLGGGLDLLLGGGGRDRRRGGLLLRRVRGGLPAGPAAARLAGTAAAAERDVRAGAERLRAVRALPDRVQQLLAGALRERAGEGVEAAGRRRVGRRRHRGRQVELAPAQRLGRVVAGLGDVHLEGALVRGRHPVLEGVRAAVHAGGGPVGAGQVEPLERRVAGAAQLAVRDELLVAPARVADADAVPVVERLRAAGRDRGLARRRRGALGALGIALRDPADRVAHRAVRGRGGGGQPGQGERDDTDDGDGGLATCGH